MMVDISTARKRALLLADIIAAFAELFPDMTLGLGTISNDNNVVVGSGPHLVIVRRNGNNTVDAPSDRERSILNAAIEKHRRAF